MHNFLNFGLHVFRRPKKLFFIVFYTSPLFSMHKEQSLLDKYCPPEIKQLIIYITLVSDKSEPLERYKELKKSYPSISLINKEFHKHSEKILFVVCNDIVNRLSKKPSNEKDIFIRTQYIKLFRHIPEEMVSVVKYAIYPSFINYCQKSSILPMKKKYEFLKLASIYDSDRIAKFLLKDTNINLNITDEHGFSYLETAVEWNSYNVIQLLLEADANVDIQGNDNQTPLWHAFFSWMNGQGSLKTIELLLQHKADMHKICRNDETVYQVAKRHEVFFNQNSYNILMALFDKYDKKKDALQQP